MDEKMGKSVNGIDPLISGNEDYIISMQMERDLSLPHIHENHCYIYEDFYSKPIIDSDSNLPSDLLKLNHSFGYDSQKRSNLHNLLNDILIYIAGNYVILVDPKAKVFQYIRSIGGQGIGAIAVHPTRHYFAIAEKGFQPTINIFKYPSLKLYRILRLGTEKAYNFVDFSPDGKYMASVGSDPDYMLSIWDWMQECILLRVKAYSQDVFRISFFADLEGYLITGGVGHIRFWKMAQTFTGLKLQGQLGKFEKREISDIEAYVGLPDGKVLSSCEWGNMLLWDGGLIKVELARKGGRPCHKGSIQQITLEEGEIITIGIDGFIRVWDFDQVDMADILNNNDIFEIEPINELKVDAEARLKTLIKSAEKNSPFWFAQDANGAIWKLDLSFSFTSASPEKLFSFHSGPISDAAVSPNHDLVSTIGTDSSIRIENYITKKLLGSIKFNIVGTALLWLPCKPRADALSLLAAGFEDGVLRILKIDEAKTSRERTDDYPLVISLVKAMKPHMSKIATLAFNSTRSLLATGSTDCTVFFFLLGHNSVQPLGFINTKMAVNNICWNCNQDYNDQDGNKFLLVSCNWGQVVRVDTQSIENDAPADTFHLPKVPTIIYQFTSSKSFLLHEEELEKIKKEKSTD